MKKIITIITLCFGAISFAQTVDFESQTLSPETFENGSGGGGDFTFNQVSFTNYYDIAWGSWNGFSISNITDNTTAGFGNQYSAFAGSGAGASVNYGVFYPMGSISVSDNGIVEGFYITNTTYAAIAMRDGDSYSKQFGSPNDANGTPDGTNGEDYFRVWIIGEDYLGMKDSLLFYLADYQFPNDNDDYIIDTWEYIDLSVLSIYPSIVDFRFESSDVGQWGINTPTYFAIDDIDYSMPVGLSEIKNTFSFYPNPCDGILHFDDQVNSVEIYSLSGEQLYSNSELNSKQIDLSHFDYGIYFIQVSIEGQLFSDKLIIH